MQIPSIKVGILISPQIRFYLDSVFEDEYQNKYEQGEWTAQIRDKQIQLTNGNVIHSAFSSILLIPCEKEGTFCLHEVTIGIGFHWERKEDQSFQSCLQLLAEENQIRAINQLSIENYLRSVISSEMSATSSIELLKAHAVISRSWLMAQIVKTENINQSQSDYISELRTEDELVKWYDREDHKNFDVCADDHCQRYQGITRASTAFVDEAINATWGEVLMSESKICDARFSKCCGGMTEIFENAWEPVPHPYLQQLMDAEKNDSSFSMDLTNEKNASKWILGKPEAFCNTDDKKVLSQVLNDYDQETNDFYRWKVVYTQNEISELIKQRSGIDFGSIEELISVERGVSGRIIKLKIIGSKRSYTIGKELEIRKTLSKTHLYSSAFVVEKLVENGNTNFILKGAGWGHGVGLCQIGAAMMSEKGYSYKEILMHYFRGAELEKQY